MNSARSALANAAAIFCAVEVQHIPDDPQQRSVRRNIDGGGPPVNSQLESHSVNSNNKPILAARQLPKWHRNAAPVLQFGAVCTDFVTTGAVLDKILPCD